MEGKGSAALNWEEPGNLAVEESSLKATTFARLVFR